MKEIVWPLPAGNLLYVGKVTERKLRNRCINTIGELAAAKPEYLSMLLGKIGLILSSFANGYDNAPVAKTRAQSLIKSIGNGVTAPRDLVCNEDVKLLFFVKAWLKGCVSMDSNAMEFRLPYGIKIFFPLPAKRN